MSSVYITEFNKLQVFQSGVVPCAMDIVATQKITIPTTPATLSAQFNAQTNFIRVQNDAPCSIDIGPSPSAVTNPTRLPIDNVEYFGVRGGVDYLSVITNT